MCKNSHIFSGGMKCRLWRPTPITHEQRSLVLTALSGQINGVIYGVQA